MSSHQEEGTAQDEGSHGHDGNTATRPPAAPTSGGLPPPPQLPASLAASSAASLFQSMTSQNLASRPTFNNSSPTRVSLPPPPTFSKRAAGTSAPSGPSTSASAGSHGSGSGSLPPPPMALKLQPTVPVSAEEDPLAPSSSPPAPVLPDPPKKVELPIQNPSTSIDSVVSSVAASAAASVFSQPPPDHTPLETTPPSISHEMASDTNDNLSVETSELGIDAIAEMATEIANAVPPPGPPATPTIDSPRTSNVNAPPRSIDLTAHHALLAQRHSSLPLLVVATSSATQQFATRNDYEGGLSELFQAAADSLVSSAVLQQLSGGGGRGSKSSIASPGMSTATPLAKLVDPSEIVSPIPFRSINRTIQLEVNADRFYAKDGTTSLLQMANLMANQNSSSAGGNDQRASVSLRFMDRDRMDHQSKSMSASPNANKAGAEGGAEDGETKAESSLVAAANTIASDCTFHPPVVMLQRQTGNRSGDIDDNHGDMSLMEITELVQRLHVNWMKRQVHSKRVSAGLATNKQPNGKMEGDDVGRGFGGGGGDDDEEDDLLEDDDMFNLAAATGAFDEMSLETMLGSSPNRASSISISTSSRNRKQSLSRKEQELQRHALLQKITGHPLLPFMKHVRQVLDSTTDYCVHEMVHCPLLHILAASTVHDDGDGNNTSTDYIQVLQELSSSIHHLPKSYQNGQFDPSDVSFGHGGAKRYMVLLHDAHLYEKHRHASPSDSGIEEFNEQMALRRMQQAFPSNECVVLSLNTSSDNNHTLSAEDMRTLRTFVVSLLRDGCIPTMERRVFYLNAVVSNAKKGVKNVFKSFWRKPKTSSNQNSMDSGLGGLLGNSIHGMSNHGGGGGGSGGLNMSNHNSSSPNSGQWDNLSFSNHGGGGNNRNNMRGDMEVPYKFDSIESQTRLLADSLFLMKDYEAALSCYRLVKDDFKADKAMIYYASIQEMMALCLYMMDSGVGMGFYIGSGHPDRHLAGGSSSHGGPGGGGGGGYHRSKYSREAYHAMENALYSYTRAADEERHQKATAQGAGGSYPARPQTAVMSTRLGTRLCLVMSAASPIANASTCVSLPSPQSSASARLLDIADLLASASSHETPLGAAVLLEQASRHYLHAMHYKKYSFHMLMSGHMYRSCRQERHAARCFSAALYMYQQSHWKELLDHLESALAQQLYSCEYFSLSLLLYMQLMDSKTVGQISSKGLNKFWNHVTEICKSNPDEAEVGAKLLREVLHHSSRRASSIENDVASSVSIASSPGDGVSHTLELCNLDLPRVEDASIQVLDMTAVLQLESNDTDMAPEGSGDDAVWSEMTDLMEAELRASRAAAAATVTNNDDKNLQTVTSFVTTDDVLSQIKTVESEKAFAKRSKAAEKPITRTCTEPVFLQVRVTNPLNVDLELSDIQLVAELRSTKSGFLSSSETRTATDASHIDATKARVFDCCPSRTFTCPEAYSCEGGASDWSSSTPYFVVEKQALALEASTQTTLTLAICPLVEGDFQILGLRAKLLGHLWTYHPFFLKGPLLQDTRTNRTNRVHGKSMLLSSKIVQEMPLLKVEMAFECKFDDTVDRSTHSMIQGELMKGTMTVRNLGRAAISNVYVKTNAPWLCLSLPNSGDGGDTAGSTARGVDKSKSVSSFALGPTGTLMQLPLVSVLEPSGAIDIPFELIARGVGKQELYLLVSYDSCKTDGVASAPTSSNISRINNHNGNSTNRMCKRKIGVSVFPSMTMTASLTPSYSSSKGSMLSLELTNYRSDRHDALDIELTDFFVASRYYRAIPLEHQFLDMVGENSTASARCDSDGVKIGWQERLTLHYALEPVQGNGTSVAGCLLSEFVFQQGRHNGQSSLQQPDVIEFACLEHAHNQFKVSGRKWPTIVPCNVCEVTNNVFNSLSLRRPFTHLQCRRT
jgi:hypothetical protein